MFTYNAYYGKVFVTDNLIIVGEKQSLLDVLDSIKDASEDNQYVIFLPPRIYYLEEPLVCKEWVHLVCPAPYGAILKPTFESSKHLIKFASNTYVHGIFMDAEYKVYGAQVYKNVHNVILRNCLFQKNADHVACSVDGGYDVLFENCIARYSHGDDGFSVEEVWDDELGDYVYGHNVTYINCKSHDHSEASGTQHGFEVEDGCHDVTFINCEAWNCAGIGIHSHSGHKGCYNITLVGGRYSRFESSIAESGKYLINLRIFGTYVEPYWKKDVEFDISADPHLWYCGLRNLKNSYINMNVRNLAVEITSCINSCFILEVEDSEKVNFSESSHCKLDLWFKRWEARPVSDLVSDVNAGSSFVDVIDTTNFEIGQRVVISDTDNSEEVIIKKIDSNEGRLFFTSSLKNSYLISKSAKIELPYKRILICYNTDGTCLAKVHHMSGYCCKPQVPSLDKTVVIYDDNYGIDIQDLTSNFILKETSKKVLFLNPIDSDRSVVPDGWSNIFYKGFEVTIKNTGDTYNLIFDPDGLNLTISPGESVRVIYDGEQWQRV